MVVKHVSKEIDEEAQFAAEAADVLGATPDSIDFFTRSFRLLGYAPNVVAVPFDIDDKLLSHIVASIIAANCGTSVSKVEKELRKELSQLQIRRSAVDGALHSAFRFGRDSMMDVYDEWDKGLPGKQTAGGAFSDVALTRLFASYDAAALLFAAGAMHEALTLCKVFLEQLGWAMAVAECESAAEAMNVKSSKCIKSLAVVYPDAGKLYGLLCRSSHLDLRDHYSFFGADGMVALRHPKESLMSSTILLDLADLWCVVFEKTQSHVLGNYRSWRLSENGSPSDLLVDREMLENIKVIKKTVIDSANSLYPTVAWEMGANGLLGELFHQLGFSLRDDEEKGVFWDFESQG